MQIKHLVIFIALVFSLASCSSRSTFALNKSSFDPMTIYSYTPLVLPPVYYISSQEISDERRFLKQNRNAIETILFGQTYSDSYVNKNQPIMQKDSTFNRNNFTEGELKILKLAKADINFYDIRLKINKETSGTIKKQNSFINKIFSNNKGEALDSKTREYVELNKR